MQTELILLLLVAAFVGTLGQILVGFSKGGFLISMAMGFIGAVLGNWLSSTYNLPVLYNLDSAGQNIPIVWSVLGAFILSILLSLVLPKRAS
ncbi:MAG: hypothetical protein Q8903_06145 [Bacteroidota bacterium]|nr:hypothetical protein [Bacteroidota bacterium]